LRVVIAATIRQALALIRIEDWRSALETLASVSKSVSTTISGELGGPVAQDLVLQLAIEFTDPDRVSLTEKFVHDFVAKGRQCRYYSDVARFELFAARLALIGGDREQASTRYQHAMSLLVAYGWHKDITIYELLGPLPALIASHQEQARER